MLSCYWWDQNSENKCLHVGAHFDGCIGCNTKCKYYTPNTVLGHEIKEYKEEPHNDLKTLDYSLYGGIKDSGDRTEFESGAVRDMHIGKGRMDLLPWHAIMEVSKHCENGALKYGEHNVDRGIPVHSLMDSGMRHAAKYISGIEDEPHLLAACWNFLWALEMTITHPECIDIPWEKEYSNER